MSRYDPDQRMQAGAALEDVYLSQPPLPANESEIADWVMSVLQDPASLQQRDLQVAIGGQTEP
jgi:hypothetical protein